MRMVNHGNKNLLLLGIGALVVTCATTTLSLYIYRSSGDIYLDRSRPGYLPDKEEAEEETGVNNSFVFSETGVMDKKELGEYLKELQKLNDRLRALSDPYGPTPLSDESLGIPAAEEKTK